MVYSAKSSTGFRDVVIYEYQEMDIDIFRSITDKEYKSLIEFCRELGANIVSFALTLNKRIITDPWM